MKSAVDGDFHETHIKTAQFAVSFYPKSERKWGSLIWILSATLAIPIFCLAFDDAIYSIPLTLFNLSIHEQIWLDFMVRKWPKILRRRKQPEKTVICCPHGGDASKL